MTPIWLSEFRANAGPRYLQIADMLERAILNGTLQPGERLPAQRRLAELLCIDLTTVTRAINEARRRQLIDARGPLGTFVAPPRIQLASQLDLSMNIPSPPADVELGALLKDGISRILVQNNSDLLMTYQVGGGSGPDRAAAARWLEPLLGDIDHERLAICPGAQAALAAIVLSASAPGDVILSEPMIYPGMPLIAAQLGRRIEAIETDADGMRPDALEAACRHHAARLIYLNPTLQNPTTATMPEARRLEILKVAERCGARIIEDDPYWRFAEHAPAPLARLMPEQVYYLSTLSKCLSPGLRTAFLHLPEARERERFLTSLRSIALMSVPLMSALATQWIHDGTAEALHASIKTESRARQQLAREILMHEKSAHDAMGIHLWHMLPAHWAARDLAAAAAREGLVVAPSEVFCASSLDALPPNAIRLSLGGVFSRAELANALRKLARLIHRAPSHRQEVVV